MDGKNVEGIHRILYVRTDRMGDALMNLPAIHLLRQSYPKAWIAWMVDASIADLFASAPDIDEVLAVNAQSLRSGWRDKWALVAQIKKARFDMAIVANPDKSLHWIMALAGIRHRVGWKRKWSFLLTKKLEDDKESAPRHEVESNLNLARLVSGAAWDGRFFLGRNEDVLARLSRRLEREIPDKIIVAVHPGSSNKKKCWPLENFAALCDKIESKTGYRAVLIGGAEEKSQTRKILSMTRSKPLDWAGELSLNELAAFFSHERVKVIVSSDSGPVHVAWMSGTPSVVLFARGVPGSNPVRWGPLDGKSIVLDKPIGEITIEEVALATESLLA